jgi:DNA repair exonuclease SbcCD ATPase subunit
MIKVSFTINQKGLRLEKACELVSSKLFGVFQLDSLHVEKVNLAKSRAERFSEAQDAISVAKSIIEELQGEMESWHDSIPENLQNSDKAYAIQEASDALSEIASNLENAETDVEFPGMFG